MKELNALVRDIEACRICAAHLPHEPRPVVRVHPDARILIAGQAPGRLVHETGVPWNDPSGDRLRAWMNLEREAFYQREHVAVAAMGFCFPGTAKGADLPPRPECAPAWRGKLLPLLRNVRLTLLVGQYAQRYHLGRARGGSLSETVRGWRAYGESIMPLPHPSWRNSAWLKRNPWFEFELVPDLQRRVREALQR